MSGRHTPWASWAEWEQARAALLSNDLHQVRLGLHLVQVWRCRGRIPLAVDTTACLLATAALDPAACIERAWQPPDQPLADDAIISQYALTILRFVNGISDSSQKGKLAASVSKHAQAVGLHPMLVDVRHEATHNRMPSLPVLRLAAAHALAWLSDNHWLAQAQHIAQSRAEVAKLLRQLWRNQEARAKVAKPTSVTAESSESEDGADIGVLPGESAACEPGKAGDARALKRAQRALLGQLRNTIHYGQGAELAAVLTYHAEAIMVPKAAQATRSISEADDATRASITAIRLLEQRYMHVSAHALLLTCKRLAGLKRALLAELAAPASQHSSVPVQGSQEGSALLGLLHATAAARQQSAAQHMTEHHRLLARGLQLLVDATVPRTVAAHDRARALSLLYGVDGDCVDGGSNAVAMQLQRAERLLSNNIGHKAVPQAQPRLLAATLQNLGGDAGSSAQECMLLQRRPAELEHSTAIAAVKRARRAARAAGPGMAEPEAKFAKATGWRTCPLGTVPGPLLGMGKPVPVCLDVTCNTAAPPHPADGPDTMVVQAAHELAAKGTASHQSRVCTSGCDARSLDTHSSFDEGTRPLSPSAPPLAQSVLSQALQDAFSCADVFSGEADCASNAVMHDPACASAAACTCPEGQATSHSPASCHWMHALLCCLALSRYSSRTVASSLHRLLPSAMMSKPTLRYLDVRPRGPLGGRGNAARLFMLANNIEFTNELQPMDSWMSGEKERYIQEGLNPLGHLPVLEYDGKVMSETISIARFMARQNGLYGKDAQIDFESDAAADAHQEWRNTWAGALMGSDEDKKEYDGKRKFYLSAMETHYKKRSAQDSVYIAGGDLPGFADTAIFNMIRDDAVLMGSIPLDEYVNLKAMYEKLDAVPEVRRWIEDWEAREV